MTKPWGGRFDADTAPDMAAFSSSLSDDALLVRDDVVGSLAHVAGLARAGIVSAAEAAALAQGLKAVLAELASGKVALSEELEDVHMNVETLLKGHVGDVAGKLHTARSRNDQVALDLRLFTRRHLLDLEHAALAFAAAALERAQDHADTVVPGFTHLQPAQPIALGHWFHAHAERALRDAERAREAFARTNVSPLGAAALAGSSFPLDPAAVARDLAFSGAFANSLDAVSDRDFAADALYASAVAATHLSGLAEELVVWCTPQFGFVSLPESYTTGSSIMPQKRNPDAAELLRGRAGRALGDLTGLLATLKGLPFAYNRDLQEAKTPLLTGLPRAVASYRIATALVAGLTVDAARASAALASGHPAATELADHLARGGLPFRDAHHVVGRLVKEADARGVTLADLPDDVLAAAGAAGARDVLDVNAAARAKTSPGGAAPERVRAAVTARAAAVAAALEANAATHRAVAAAEDALLGVTAP